MTDQTNIAILIMAAGESKRMQGIKQLLPWKGTSLITHAIKTIRSAQQENSYLVLGANAETIRREAKLRDEGVVIIENPLWQNGLGTSISYGINHILELNVPFDGILICLADQPLLSSQYYKKMIHEFNKNAHTIVATNYGSRAGVPAIFHRSIIHELSDLNVDHGAKDVLTKHETSVFRLDAGEEIIDIDTPEEYLKLYKQYH